MVKAHRNAADHHDLAAQAHRDLATHHNNQAALHSQTGNTQLVNHHASQIALHHKHAKTHDALANHHRNAAQAVNGPNHAELQRTLNSAHFAQDVHSGLADAAKHRQKAAVSRAVGDHTNAQRSMRAATIAHSQAMSHYQTPHAK